MEAVCPVCGAGAVEGAESCPACGARFDGTGGPTAVAAATDLPAAGAWRRFFARSFDVSIATIVAVILLSILFAVAGTVAHRNLTVFLGSSVLQRMIAGVVLLPIALFVDAVVYRIFGNCPGKEMLGVVVRDPAGARLDFKRYLNRNLRVWAAGYALGIPIVSLITMAWQGIRLGDQKPASYDVSPGYRVLAKPIGGWRKSGFGAVYVGLLLLFVVGSVLAYQRDHGRQVVALHAVSAWTNPVTGRSAAIGAGWQYTAERTPGGWMLYQFEHGSEATAVLAAHLDGRSGATLAHYVGAFTEGMKRVVRLSGDGRYFSDHGHEAWSGSGTTLGPQPTTWSAEILQVGNGFWLIQSVQKTPAATGSDVEKLESALWGTIL